MSGNDAQDGRSQDSKAPAGSDFSSRLRRLEAEVDRRQPSAGASADGAGGSPSGPSPLGRAFRMSTEFVAGVIAGGGLGWLVDRWLGTSPWGLIVLLLLGFVAGIYNVMRASGFSSGRANQPPR